MSFFDGEFKDEIVEFFRSIEKMKKNLKCYMVEEKILWFLCVKIVEIKL